MRRSRILFPAVIVLLLSSFVLPAHGAAPDPNLWLDAPGYEATVKTQEQMSGLVFTNADYQKLLLVPDGGSVAYIFLLSSGELMGIPRSAVKIDENGALVSPGARASLLGTFAREKADIQFDSDSLSIRVGPKPDLVGEVTLETILARKPGYKAMAAEYKPDEEAIAQIRAYATPAEILVFFGTWCPTCSRRLPLFMKTMEAAGNPNLQVRYTAIDEKYTEPAELLKAYKIHIAPVFIVLSGGKEIGRIEKSPRVSVERDLAEILKTSR